MLSLIKETLSALADIFTIIGSGIAIWLFLTKKDAINSIYEYLKNKHKHSSITRILENINKCNEYNVSDEQGREAVILILSDIKGQIEGNGNLFMEQAAVLSKITKFCSGKNLTEASKRSLLSFLREKVEHESFIDLQKDVKL